jgi:tetratricopeptide (TPR) repeat protein
MTRMVRKGAVISAATLIVAAGMVVPAGVRAQNPPAAAAVDCDINENSPRDVQRAYLALAGAPNDTILEQAIASMRPVITYASTDLASGQNIPARHWIIAQAISRMLKAKAPAMTTRGAIGLENNPGDRIDLVVALDSLLRSVEASNPNCADDAQRLRFGEAWLHLYEQATVVLHAGNPDSAEFLIKRAQILENKSPYTWQLLASIAMNRDDFPKAIEYWQKTYETAALDSLAADVRLQALYFLGEMNLGMATSRTGTEAVAPAREAMKHFRQYLQEAPTHKDAPAARANLVTAIMAAGDTAQVATVYADLLANPANYTSRDHLQAGVAAFAANLFDDASRLFASGLVDSPYDRDLLFNLAISLYQLKDFDRLRTAATRLLDLDPNNNQNLEMIVVSYLTLEGAETDAARKQVWTDSLGKYNEIYEKALASHNVIHNLFQKEENLTTLGGEIENLGDADRTFTIEYDFLNKEGMVIGTGSATVGPIKKDEKLAFKVVVERGGIVAWRGKRIPPPE